MKAFLDDIIQSFKPDPRILAQRQLAHHHQWHFKARQKTDREALDLMQLDLFKGIRGKRLTAIMSMPSTLVNGRFRIYDYLYFGDISKKATTVFEYANPALRLSPFSIQPKGMLSSVKDLFVSADLLFATTPEFNKRYQIYAKDQAATKLDLNEDFLDYVGDEEGWTYEGKGHFLIAYQYGKRMPTGQIAEEFKRFERMCERLVNGRSSSEFV